MNNAALICELDKIKSNIILFYVNINLLNNISILTLNLVKIQNMIQ